MLSASLAATVARPKPLFSPQESGFCFSVSRGNLALMARVRELPTNPAGDEVLGTVGDVDFPSHGGGEVYKSEQGYMLEFVVTPDGDFGAPAARWRVYQVELVKGVPEGSLKQVAKFADWRPSELKEAFEGDDIMARAEAYVDWAGYYGWEMFDEAPLVLDKRTVEERYDTEIEPYDEDEEDEEDENDDPFSDEEFNEGYIISNKVSGALGSGRGVVVTQANKRVGVYEDKEEAMKAINKRMEKEGFFPNVYFVNERGNVDLLDEKGNIVESRV
jgi:site-specific DNA-cytosine methylase